MCVTVPYFVTIVETVAEIWRFFYFSSWNCCSHMGTTQSIGALYVCAKFGWNCCSSSSFDNKQEL